MGYSIYIGNAVLKAYEDDLYACYEVEHTTHPDAPRWPNPVGEGGKPDMSLGFDISADTNGRHPGYGSMANWARETGLYDLFFGEDGRSGLLNPHPGCQHLTAEILTKITTAREKWQASHPTSNPGWGESDDSTLAKLLWYEWWVDWALKNCKTPAISNT